MATVIVKITETLERSLTIHCVSSIQEALSSVQGEYKKENIILDSSDFTSVIFSAEEINDTDPLQQYVY